jgi:hypothetical protein
MKTILILLVAAVSALPLCAQETTEPLPAQAPAGSTAAGPETLIPEPPPLVPKSGADESNAVPSPDQAFKKSKTGSAISDVEQRIRFRKAKTQVLQDAKLDSLRTEAYNARTDVEKRAMLKSYYTQLFDRILKIDSSLKPEVERRRKVALARVDQSRLRGLGGDEAVFEAELDQE